jgi:hypothetical protein
LGEELGWRGYARPRLVSWARPSPRAQRQGQRGKSAGSTIAAGGVTGVLWAGWHLPLFWWTSPLAGGPLLLEFALYVLVLTAFSILVTAVYTWTDGRLWPIVLVHAALTATGNTIVVALAPGRAGIWLPYLVYVLCAWGAALAAVAWPGRLAPAPRPYQGVPERDTEAAFRV